MKICLLSHTFPRNKKDTTAAFMKEFADGLVEAGNQVVVLLPFDQDFKPQEHKFKVITYKYIWPENWHVLGYSRAMIADISLKIVNYLFLPFLILFGTLALVKVIRKENIDLVNVHWILPNGLIAFLASLITGVGYVVTVPGTDASLAERNKAFGLVAKLIALGSKGVVSNSSFLLKKITNLGIGKVKTGVISYPTDVSLIKPVRKGLAKYRDKLGIKNNEVVVMAVGRLVYKKGFAYLIKAMSKVLKRMKNIKLIIIGEGELMAELKSLSKKEGISDEVIFTGNVARDDLIFYYNLADIMVAPSIVDVKGNVDGGPVVSLESMACGKPQILTTVLGMADETEDGVNGFIIPQKNSKELSKAILKLAEDEKLRERFGKNNRKLVLSRLSTKGIGKRYTEFFKEVTLEK